MEDRRDRHGTPSIDALWAGLVWTAGAATATLGSSVFATCVAALTGLVLAVCVPGPLVQRAALVAVATPIALLDHAPTWPWLVAGVGLLVIALATPAAVRRPGGLEAVERGLAWYRRRGEPADVLVVRAADPTRRPATGLAQLAATFRAADAVALSSPEDPHLVCALLDASGLDRSVVERRIRTAAPEPVLCRWASFPRDGATVAALLDHALADDLPVSLPEPVPYPALTLGDAS